MEPILTIRHLSLSLPVKKGMAPILHDVSLDVEPGQILGLVGESGSGKSMTAFAVTRLLPGGGREKLGGSIRFCGEELTEKSEKDMQAIRGRDISMIFQEPMTCLNPVFTIGRQMTDVIMTHQHISRAEAMKKAEDMLSSVHIRNAADVLRSYPYELSGGMRQRVMIGIALSCRPKLLIADEPTTALDVTVQAKILYLIREACRRLGTAVIFISHDLGVISEICDTVAVMYSGHIVEYGAAADVFRKPEHPYTRALMAAVPKFTVSAAAGPGSSPSRASCLTRRKSWRGAASLRAAPSPRRSAAPRRRWILSPARAIWCTATTGSASPKARPPAERRRTHEPACH